MKQNAGRLKPRKAKELWTLADAKSGRGFGITGMHERVELSGGQFSIESAPGKGTSICAVWPIADEESSCRKSAGWVE